jgi:hypothetical protein
MAIVAGGQAGIQQVQEGSPSRSRSHARAASSTAGAEAVPAACAAECAAAGSPGPSDALTEGATCSTNGCPASAAAVSSTRLGWMPFFFSPVFFLLHSQAHAKMMFRSPFGDCDFTADTCHLV